MSSNYKCDVCADDETNENPIFVCEECDVGVHMLCYGITVPDNSTDPWWCSPCSIGRHGTVCALCLKSGGAIKKTTCGN